jgi:hypothetical protein
VNLAEADIVFKHMRGCWPRPEIEEPEAERWLGKLLSFPDARLAVEVLTKLSDGGLAFRPNPGDFHRAYVAEMSHREATHPPAGELTQGAIASPEYNRAQIGMLRDALARIGKVAP